MTLRLGKLPARPDAVSFKFASFANLAELPTPPTKFGHAPSGYTWQMLGNDRAGDCVFAGAAHETMLWNLEANSTVVFDDTSVLSDYSAVTGFNPNDPNSDQGTDMQVAASYRRKTGVVDSSGKRHTVAAYLAITPGNRVEVKQAIYLFSNVGIGFRFPASAMGQFHAGKAWTVVASSPIEGGHYTPAIGYDSRYVYVVSWGKLQKMSWGFFNKYCDEAVVYLSAEYLTADKSLEGFDLATLQADLAKLN